MEKYALLVASVCITTRICTRKTKIYILSPSVLFVCFLIHYWLRYLLVDTGIAHLLFLIQSPSRSVWSHYLERPESKSFMKKILFSFLGKKIKEFKKSKQKYRKYQNV